MTQEESGIDELLRLSGKFKKQQEDHEKQERQRIEQGKKVKGVLQGLQNLNLQMALEQLKTVANPEIIRQVTTLSNGTGTEGLRKMITNLADDIERQLGTLNPARTDTAPLANSMRTLNILLDLYFSLN